MNEVSDELLALQEADALIREKRKLLYDEVAGMPFLPKDATTKAAFSALCGAQRYIERLTREHVTGSKAAPLTLGQGR
jgi:hypothetical protein